jgi:hypothetical protein
MSLSPGSSLKYASPGEALCDFPAEPQFLTRERLCRALGDELSPADAEHFGSMVTWGLWSQPTEADLSRTGADWCRLLRKIILGPYNAGFSDTVAMRPTSDTILVSGSASPNICW